VIGFRKTLANQSFGLFNRDQAFGETFVADKNLQLERLSVKVPSEVWPSQWPSFSAVRAGPSRFRTVRGLNGGNPVYAVLEVVLGAF